MPTHKRNLGAGDLILNSPFEEPAYYWSYDRKHRVFTKLEGRRPAGYVVASPDAQGFDDPGRFIPLDLVNRIRPLVQAWRESNYPGITSVTRKLLEHWRDPDQRESRRFFFCQLEAIETLIWLRESRTSRVCQARAQEQPVGTRMLASDDTPTRPPQAGVSSLANNIPGHGEVAQRELDTPYESVDSERWWPVPAMVRQDGNGQRENDRDGDGDRLAGA